MFADVNYSSSEDTFSTNDLRLLGTASYLGHGVPVKILIQRGIGAYLALNQNKALVTKTKTGDEADENEIFNAYFYHDELWTSDRLPTVINIVEEFVEEALLPYQVGFYVVQKAFEDDHILSNCIQLSIFFSGKTDFYDDDIAGLIEDALVTFPVLT